MGNNGADVQQCSGPERTDLHRHRGEQKLIYITNRIKCQ